MTNHLANSTSPYLLQHAGNPVDWYPWGPEALERSRAENKPIFLSIGYAACHWCHVMAHESFEDPQVAAIMNQNFVCIKVDREERPDLDSVYMAATQALTGSGGWPMSVFLAPDLRPFYAGTYFPPVQRYNMPAFREILESLARAWAEERGEVERVSDQVLQHIQPAPQPSSAQGSLAADDLPTITAALLESYDWGYGGWGGPPKFPQPMLIEFLLRRSIGEDPAVDQARTAARHVLDLMARGGMCDVVGGGFARYSTDNFWRVPHFEKMLYDNAQLARVYLHAWQITRQESYKDVVTATLDFVQRELTGPEGGFYSSLDADSEGEEGKFYVWTIAQVRESLPDDTHFELFSAAYGLTDRGNWEGVNVLQRAMDDATLAVRFKRTESDIAQALRAAHASLLARRAQRVRPGIDDKVLTAWNGLMLRAFTEAARFLDDKTKPSTYLTMATRNADFILTLLRPSGHLYRSWRAGNTGHLAFLEDYAALSCGLLELYQADFNDRWYTAAQQLADEMIDRFSDPAGGFFDTPDGAETLPIRPKDLQDNATPSGNALACEALLKLAAFSDRGDYRDLAESSLARVSDPLRRFPAAFGHWLNAADFALSPVKQLALVSPNTIDGLADLLQTVNENYQPNMIVAASSYPPSDLAPPLLSDRSPKNGKATAYVCQRFVCKQPVTSPEELRGQL